MLKDVVILVFIWIILNQATKFLNTVVSILKELVKLFK